MIHLNYLAIYVKGFYKMIEIIFEISKKLLKLSQYTTFHSQFNYVSAINCGTLEVNQINPQEEELYIESWGEVVIRTCYDDLGKILEDCRLKGQIDAKKKEFINKTLEELDIIKALELEGFINY